MILKLIVNSIAIFVLGHLLRGVQIKSYWTALWVTILLVLVNTFVRPIVLFLTLPLTILTLGLFILVVNALMLMLVDFFVEGLKIKNFGWALLFSALLSLINMLLF